MSKLENSTPITRQDNQGALQSKIDFDSNKGNDDVKTHKCYGKGHFTTRCIKCEIVRKCFQGVSSKPDEIPGCFGGYSSSILAKCVYCNVQLECARKTAGED